VAKVLPALVTLVRRVSPMLAAAFVTTLASRAHAHPTSKLTYVRGSGAETCPDESELRRGVAARVGYDPFFPFADRTVVVQIERQGQLLHGTLRVLGKEGALAGERRLEGRAGACGELVKSLALAVSLALDELESQPAPPPRESPGDASDGRDAQDAATAVAPTAPAAKDPRGAERASEAPAASPGERAPWAPFTSIMVGGATGLGPGASFAGSVGVGLARGALSLALEGRASSGTGSFDGGVSVEGSLFTGGLVGCLRRERAVTLALCAVAFAGAARATAAGVPLPRADTTPFLGTGLRGEVDAELLGPLHGFVQGEVGLPLGTYDIVVGSRVLYEYPLVYGLLGVGLRVVLGGSEQRSP